MYTGGIQRALINTLRVLESNKELKIDLFLFSDIGELGKEIPENVNVIKSNYLLKLTATPFLEILKNGRILDKTLRIILTLFVRVVGSKIFFRLLFLFQKKADCYDVAISYFNDIPGGYFNKGGNQYVVENVIAKKKLGWIHTDPIKAKFSRKSCLKTYRKFDSIVNVSKSGKEKFDSFIPEYKNKTSVVYNFFPYDAIRKEAGAHASSYETGVKNFVTVARIDNVSKRIDRIVKVVKMLKESGYINFKWWIIGDGPDLEQNLALSVEYGLDNLIEFLGEKMNPFPYVKHADAFILASDYEGFPMVIGETLALGIPIITTAYSSVKEQLEDGVDGIIVKADTNSLFEALKLILDDEKILLKLKDNSSKRHVGNDLALGQLYDLLK